MTNRLRDDLRHIAFTPSVVMLALTALLMLLPMIPPNGVLNDNEEPYFAAALHYVDPHAEPAASAVTGSTSHAFLFYEIAGHPIRWIGFEATQVLGRSLVILLYAFSLAQLFRLISFGPVDVVLVLGGFYLAGQELMGGEWLFRGLEPKVLAYPFVFLALTEAMRDRLARAALLMAAATWFHFLVGGFWMTLLFATLFVQGVRGRRMFQATACYVITIAPLVAFLFWQGYGTGQVPAGEHLPSIGWIFTFYFAPDHANPFASVSVLRQWVPGVLAAAVILVLATLLSRSSAGPTRLLASMTAIGNAYLLAAFLAAALDTGGHLGPFLMFRPSSLLLFIALLLAVAWAHQLGKQGQILRSAAAFLIVAITAPALASDSIGPVLRQRASLVTLGPLFDFARTVSQPGSVFLVEPILERSLLSFERRTARALLVIHKFPPATAPEIVEWFRRRLFQDAVFAGDCTAPRRYHLDYLVATRSSSTRLLPHCGSIAAEFGEIVVIATEPNVIER